MQTQRGQVKVKPKNVCSVAEMYMLSEGHMFGLNLKAKKCLNSAQKNSICGSNSLLDNATDTAAAIWSHIHRIEFYNVILALTEAQLYFRDKVSPKTSI